MNEACGRALGVAAALVCAVALLVAIPGLGWYGDLAVRTTQWNRADTYREYDNLADSLIEGHAWLDVEPPAWLVGMANPYDRQARDALAAQTGEYYLWDSAYYGGRYWCYFGILPCLVFYVPFHLLTGGAAFPTGLAVVACAWAFLAGVAALVEHARRRWFPHVGTASCVLAFLGVSLGSSLEAALVSPGLYALPIAMGMALDVWGLWLWSRAWERRSPGMAAAGSALLASVLATRPPLAIASAFLLPFMAAVLGGGEPGASKARWLGALALPFALVGVVVGWYNAIRFGSPLDFGSAYNLTAVDVANRRAQLGWLASGAWSYLLQPPSLVAAFPFLSAVPLDGSTYVEPMAGGLVWLGPFLLSWAGARMAWRHDRRRTAVACALAGMGLALLLFDSLVGGILFRYQLDFDWLLVLSAALVALAAADGLAERGGPPALWWTRLLVALVAVEGIAFLLATAWLMGGGSGYSGLDLVGSVSLLQLLGM
jgi:hypothetical protein